MAKIIITSGGKLTNQVNQTITGTGGVGNYVSIFNGTTLLGTTTVNSAGSWSLGISLPNIQGTHSITAIESSGAATLTLAAIVNPSGSTSEASLTFDAAGNAYGVTRSGGANKWGTVFKIAAETNTLSILHNFKRTVGADYGSGKSAIVIDAAGNLFGTTAGNNNTGSVYKIAADTNAFTTLVSNTGFTNAGFVVDSAGNLYGPSANGGSGYGTIIKIAANTHTVSTVASFSAARFNVTGLIIDKNGNLFGTTDNNGLGNGSVKAEIL
jgi:uncharacterized repeat protein (TIGR03803 family)